MLKRPPAVRIGCSSVLITHRTTLRNHAEGREDADCCRESQNLGEPSIGSTGRFAGYRVHTYFVATKNSNTPSQSTVMQCQYSATTSVAVFRNIRPDDHHKTASKPAMPPRRCSPCATVNT